MMNPFNYSYPVNVYLGEGAAAKNMPAELSKVGENVLLYRHYLPEAIPQFARLATEVWGVDPKGKYESELAEEFITALSSFVYVNHNRM